MLLQVCGGLAACIPVLAEAIQSYPRYIYLCPQCKTTIPAPHGMASEASFQAAEASRMCAGETWQATLDDGSNVYFEQMSHHPPVSAFQLIGPGMH